MDSQYNLPPFINSNIRRTSKPRIYNEYAAECVCIFEALSQGGVVVQAESFAEPVHDVLAGGTARGRRGRSGRGGMRARARRRL